MTLYTQLLLDTVNTHKRMASLFEISTTVTDEALPTPKFEFIKPAWMRKPVAEKRTTQTFAPKHA